MPCVFLKHLDPFLASDHTREKWLTVAMDLAAAWAWAETSAPPHTLATAWAVAVAVACAASELLCAVAVELALELASRARAEWETLCDGRAWPRFRWRHRKSRSRVGKWRARRPSPRPPSGTMSTSIHARTHYICNSHLGDKGGGNPLGNRQRGPHHQHEAQSGSVHGPHCRDGGVARPWHELTG